MAVTCWVWIGTLSKMELGAIHDVLLDMKHLV